MNRTIEVEYNGRPVELELTKDQMVSIQQQMSDFVLERIEDQRFFYIDLQNNCVVPESDVFSEWDDKKWNSGNYFLTEKEAQSYLDAVTLKMRISHFAKTLTETNKDFNLTIAFSINYHPITNEFTVESSDITKAIPLGGFYPSRDVAKRVIEKFGKEFIEIATK